jgi:VWFA-related protein
VAEAPAKNESVAVGYVLVPIVVTDQKGRPVQGLKEKDFVLFCEGRRVVVDLFEEAHDAPVSFTILLDGSGSMALAGKLEGAKEALRALVEKRRTGDDFSLHVFSSGEVREVIPFTTEPGVLLDAVDRVRPFGKTAFYDALVRMPDRSLLGKNGSRAIILLSDGIDNASTLTRDKLREILEGIDVPVYPIGLRNSATLEKWKGPGARTGEALINLEILEDIARASGGQLAVTEEPKGLRDAISSIEKDLRAQYLLGFSPTGKGQVRFRSLAVTLARPVRVVRMRAGYKGTAPPYRGGSPDAMETDQRN